MLVMGERNDLRETKILIFGKVWEWLPLVWKLLGYLVVVFWSYLESPSSHIIKNPKNDPNKSKNQNDPKKMTPRRWIGVSRGLGVNRSSSR